MKGQYIKPVLYIFQNFCFRYKNVIPSLESTHTSVKSQESHRHADSLVSQYLGQDGTRHVAWQHVPQQLKLVWKATAMLATSKICC